LLLANSLSLKKHKDKEEAMFGFIIKSWCRKDMTDFNI